MKFRFCGDGDCPDWVLAEIISKLSTLTAENLEKLAGLVAKRIIDDNLDEDDIKICIGTDSYEGKSAIACVHFLLVNAARHNVAESVFNEEIQQLGLPKDHAAAVSRVLTANATSIRQKLVDKAFKINELTSVRYISPTEDTKTINCATFEIKLSDEVVNDLPEECTTHIVNMSYENVKALLEELKIAQDLIQQNSIEEWSGAS
ncbi:COMM domain-containing protein 4 isoform X2 [Teleopsis dalmanni]|uniref:COMM domain-containing protein 4 isoform X2 n=1 Tax=Teleopsis dalmanni TaxID=139649 RepID=UPI0018CF6E9A|nr:COMM domain-containing protein 4 isoform X2 [Teleopsis dalmanni]